MPIFTMEIDKRPVMAFSGDYSTDADWDAVPFFNMLKGDLREIHGLANRSGTGSRRSKCGSRHRRKCKPGTPHVSLRDATGL